MRRVFFLVGVLPHFSGPRPLPAHRSPEAVDLTAHKPASGVAICQDDTTLRIRWPMAEGEYGVNGRVQPTRVDRIAENVQTFRFRASARLCNFCGKAL